MMNEEKSRCYLASAGGKMKRKDIRRLVIIGLLIGLNVILSRLMSISNQSFKIGLSFITIVIVAYLYGTFYSCIAAGISDLLGSLLFPIGAYNPLFTLTAMLSGLVYGLFLHKELETKNIIFAVLINKFIVSLLINTFFISTIFKASFKALLITRLYSNIIMTIIEIVVIKSISKFLIRMREINE